MTQDEIIDIDILEYLQYLIHKGIIPCDVTLNKAVSEIESLRAKLARQAQSKPSQSFDEEDAVFPILSGGIFKHENLGELYDRLQVHSYAVKHCQHFVDSLSKTQPTSQDVLDAERWRHYACNQTAVMLGSDLDHNDDSIDWLEECNKLADAAMKESK